MKSPFVTSLVASMLMASLQLSSYANAQVLPSIQQGGVSGAPANYNQYDGSGRGMMNNCPYAQTQYDPASRFDKDPEVMEVKQDVKEANDHVTDLQKQEREAKRAYNLQKWKLNKNFTDNYKLEPDVLMKQIDSCVKVSQNLTAFTDKAVGEAIRGSTIPASAQGYCLGAILPMMKGSNNINIQYWCIEKDYVDKDKGTQIVGKANTTDTQINDCGTTLDETYKSWKDITDLDKQIKAAIKEQTQANKELATARKEAEENAQNNPPDATTVACSECGNQQPGISKGRFWGALGLIAGVSTLSILGQEHQYNNIARMGYIGNPNQIGIFGSGISSGLSAGFPFLQSAMYGQTGLGAGRGGYGCAQTVNGSQFGQQQGPFYNGAQNGNYFPAGGQYAAQAGPWGVSPYPGQFGSQYPYGQQNGYGGYNPQAQYAQYMNTQYIDQLRAQQVAMADIQYGLNNANQQFGYAQNLLASQQSGGGFGGGGYGGYGGGGFGGGYNGGGFGGSGGYFGGGQQWGGGQQQFFNGAGCGGNSFGSSFSVCGSIVGGSLQPTNTNYNYQNYNNGQNGSYYNSGLNSSGAIFVR